MGNVYEKKQYVKKIRKVKSTDIPVLLELDSSKFYSTVLSKCLGLVGSSFNKKHMNRIDFITESSMCNLNKVQDHKVKIFMLLQNPAIRIFEEFQLFKSKKENLYE